MKITYYAASSIDGFIAKENGDVSWLDDLNIDMEDTGYDEFFNSVDGLIMGRNTYDFVYRYGSWPYGDKPTWICTHNKILPLEGANLNIVSTIDEVVHEAEKLKLTHLWLVGGGKLASSFLNKGLLTHFSISEMPVKLKTGIPLLASHKLMEIPTEKRVISERKGFRQIDITLK